MQFTLFSQFTVFSQFTTWSVVCQPQRGPRGSSLRQRCDNSGAGCSGPAHDPHLRECAEQAIHAGPLDCSGDTDNDRQARVSARQQQQLYKPVCSTSLSVGVRCDPCELCLCSSATVRSTAVWERSQCSAPMTPTVLPQRLLSITCADVMHESCSAPGYPQACACPELSVPNLCSEPVLGARVLSLSSNLCSTNASTGCISGRV